MPITIIDEDGTRVCNTRATWNTVRFDAHAADETIIELDDKSCRSTVGRYQITLADVRAFAKSKQPGGMFAGTKFAGTNT